MRVYEGMQCTLCKTAEAFCQETIEISVIYSPSEEIFVRLADLSIEIIHRI